MDHSYYIRLVYPLIAHVENTKVQYKKLLALLNLIIHADFAGTSRVL